MSSSANTAMLRAVFFFGFVLWMRARAQEPACELALCGPGRPQLFGVSVWQW